MDILGLAEGPRPAFSRPGYWLYAGDFPLVHLIESEREPAGEKDGYLDHVAFAGRNLEVLVGKLKSAGIEYDHKHIDELSLDQLFFRDPAGIRVEINIREDRE